MLSGLCSSQAPTPRQIHVLERNRVISAPVRYSACFQSAQAERRYGSIVPPPPAAAASVCDKKGFTVSAA